MTEKIKKTRTPQQIGKASKQKGARFELEIAHYFKDHGFPDAHRTAQHCGKTGDAGDVEGVPNLHIECKHVEKLNLYNAYHQSVVHKKNRETVMGSLSLDDFIKILSVYNQKGDC